MARGHRPAATRTQGFTIVELLIVIVVIAILAGITIVAYNGVTDQARTATMKAELAQWRRQAAVHMTERGIECPSGYAFVYGRTELGTDDFCVMKYEARNVGGVATSQPSGTPWISISQTNAISTASAACDGCHLISEAEWMTIAADVLSVKYNWSGGEVGSGYIYSGHNDNAPANALAASSDDFDGYIGTGNSASSGANQRRTLYLTSGDAVWDLAGNVWEWTSGATAVSTGASGSTWHEYPEVSDWGSLPSGSRPSALNSLPRLTSIDTWGSDQGLGRLVTGWNPDQGNDPGVRAFHRSGRWGNGAGAGLLTLALDTAPGTGYTFTGFRVAK